MTNATKLKKTHLIRHHIHRLKTNEYFRILILRTVGNFLLFLSLFMIAKTFWQPLREEIRYFIDIKIQKKYIVAGDKQGLLAKTFNIKQVEILIPEDPNFSIIIPKIGANARILSNIDASNEKIYLDALNKGVAHTLGTAFPGEGGHIFLFAHSTDYFWNVSTYNAVFYLLSKLKNRDEVDIFYQ